MPSRPAQPGSTRLILNVLVLLWLLLLLGFSLVDKAPSHALQTPWFFYHLAWCLLPWLWLSLKQAFGESLRRFGGLADLGFALFASFQILSAVFSPSPLFCLINLPLGLAPIGIAYVTLNLMGTRKENPAKQRLLERGALVFLLLFASVSLSLWTLNSLLPWLARNEGITSLLNARNGWPLGHSNFTANIAAVGLLWALSLFPTETRRWRALAVLCIVASLVCVLSSGSRAGLLSVAAGLTVWTLARLTRFSPGTKLAAYGLACLLGALALIVVLKPDTLGMLGLGRSREEFSTSDLQRKGMFETGLRMIHERPFLGEGPGLIPRAYLRLRVDQVGATDSVIQLHSTPFQVAAELGIPALLAGLLVLGSALVRRAHPALLPAAAGLLVYSLFDYQGELPAVATLWALFAALLLGEGQLAGKADPTPRPSLRYAHLLGALCLWAWVVLPGLRARLHFGQAMEAFFQGNLAQYDEHFSEARRMDPREPFYPLVQAQLMADPEGHGAPAGSIAPNPDKALASYATCVELDPSQETAHFNRAWLLLQTQPVAAEESFRKAAALAPTRGSAYRGLGLALALQGKQTEAIRAFAREIANNPSHAISPLWAEPLFAPLAAPARMEAIKLLRLASELAQKQGRLGETKSAHYTADLLTWLGDAQAPLPTQSANSEQAALLRWLAGEEQTNSRLDKAAQCKAPEQGLRLLEPLLGPGPLSGQVLNALQRGDRRSLLLPGGLPANSVLIRYQRLGYGLVMHNLDAPILSDLCATPENPVVKTFFNNLFPARAHLSTSLLDQASVATHP